MGKQPTERFSDRVENYVKYRPRYPAAVVDTLIERCQLTPSSMVIDVGAGTGIFTQNLLSKGLHVTAVEPNDEMRLAAESTLASYDRFTSIAGSAEATGVGDHSVDLIVAAQAFHWFQPDETRKEFLRVLKPRGRLALIWNQRKVSQPFQQAYDALLRKHAPEYSESNHMNIGDAAIAKFFGSKDYEVFHFDQVQKFDKSGFLGRMLSSSYTPAKGTAGHSELIAAAEQLFDDHESGGEVLFEYDTQEFVGVMTGSHQ